MEERRRESDLEVMSIKSDISLIKKDVEYIKQFIEDDRERMAEHLTSSVEYRNKVIELDGMKEEFKDHKIADRWIQGLIAVTQVSIIGMLIKLVVR